MVRRLAARSPRRPWAHVSAHGFRALGQAPAVSHPHGPESVGHAELLVTLTGIAEIAIALGLQLPRFSPWAAVAAILMLCGLFPANRKAAREHHVILNRPVPSLLPRALAQIFFIALLAASAWPR